MNGCAKSAGKRKQRAVSPDRAASGRMAQERRSGLQGLQAVTTRRRACGRGDVWCLCARERRVDDALDAARVVCAHVWRTLIDDKAQTQYRRFELRLERCGE